MLFLGFRSVAGFSHSTGAAGVYGGVIRLEMSKTEPGRLSYLAQIHGDSPELHCSHGWQLRT